MMIEVGSVWMLSGSWVYSVKKKTKKTQLYSLKELTSAHLHSDDKKSE